MIGIFDSGIGGATVLHELLKVLPLEDYLYYADELHAPYGDKTKEELEKYTSEVVEYLIEKNCKIIVIACNTASACCKEYLRKKYKIPIVAIEPAYKMIHDKNKNSKTLIMATNGTIHSKPFQELLQKYDNQNTVVCSCSGLADLIEENNKEKIDAYLKERLDNYSGIESVVLGCTHYPLIKEEITKVLGKVKFYDGSRGVSLQTKKILTDNNLLNTKEEKGKIIFINSKKKKRKEKMFFDIVNLSKI